MKQIAVLAALALCPIATAQGQLTFPTNPGNYVRILGGKFFVGSQQVSSTAPGLSTQPTQRSQIVIYPNAPNLGGSGNDIPTDAKLDTAGNIWIVGDTDSDDFLLVNPIVSNKVPYRVAGFLVELDPTASRLLFSTYIGGQDTSTPFPHVSHATALAIDPAGNVYVGGDTTEPDFPTTPGAILSFGPGGDFFGSLFSYSFLLKVSTAGKLVFSTLLTTGAANCLGGSSCIGRNSTHANIPALAVDSSGTVTVAGAKGGATASTGYVSRIAPDGSKVLWSAQVGLAYGSVDTLFMAQEANGAIDLLGRYVPLLVDPGLPPQAGTPPGLFAAKLSSDGSRLGYSTDLGQSPDAAAIAVSLDNSGNAYLVGTSSSAKFPAIAGVPNLGANFVLRLDSTGSKPQTLFRFPSGVAVAPAAFDSNGNLLSLGSQGALLTMSPKYDFSTPALVGFANSASYSMNTGLYPQTLVSLFGYNLAGATQVLANGSAQILYAGRNQINIEVPSGCCSFGSTVSIVLPSGTLSFKLPAVQVQSVGIFTVDGSHAAALNEDGTVNSATNPASMASIVSLFGTGASNAYATVSVNSRPQNLLYFGAALGLPGVFQANVRLTASGPIILQTAAMVSGELASNPVQVYTK